MSESRELVNYDAQFAAQAAAMAEQWQRAQTGVFLSSRGGKLTFGEDELPGNEVCVVVIDSYYENTYYTDKYDPDSPAAPRCYAFSRTKPGDLAPHPSMQGNAYFEPQNDVCAGCPQNEWGSANTGRGKACQNRGRLVMIPAGMYVPRKNSRDTDLELFTDPDHFKTADAAFYKLPVTSVEQWSKYVSSLHAQHRLPAHGVITRMFLVPHEKHQYHVHFEMIEKLPPELIPAVMARYEEAQAAPFQGYTPPEEPEAAPNGGVRGLRRRG